MEIAFKIEPASGLLESPIFFISVFNENTNSKIKKKVLKKFTTAKHLVPVALAQQSVYPQSTGHCLDWLRLDLSSICQRLSGREPLPVDPVTGKER